MTEYTGSDNLEIMAEAVNYNRFLISLIHDNARAGEAMLDFGAGIGTFAKILAADGLAVHCLEPDAKQAAMIAAAGLPVSTSLADIADASLDFIYSFNVFEHIEDDTAVLRECFAKLKPGGRILVYVPAFQVLYSSMDRKVGHFRRYTRAQLARRVTDAGFAVTRNEYVDSAGFFASLVYKWTADDSGDINRQALAAYDRFVFPVSRVGDFFLRRLIGKNVYLTARRASA